MGTRLLQTLAFVGVPAAGVAALPHNINIAGTQYKPDFVAADASGFTVVVTTTTVTVTNTNAAPASVNIWLELKHTIPRELSNGTLTPQPFVASAGSAGGSPTIIVEDEGVAIPGNPFTVLNFMGAGVTAADAGGGQANITVPGGGGGAQAVIFDDAVPADEVNIRSDRASNQSPIDNTKIQITNLGSQDGTVDPTAVGVVASTGTIGGGNDNSVTGAGGTVAGGAGNVVNGILSSIAGGDQNYIDGDYAHIGGGQFNYLFGVASHAEGFGTDGEADYCHVEGDGTFIDTGSTGAHAEGNSVINNNALRSHAENDATIDDGCTDCHGEGNAHIDDNATYSHGEGHNTLIGAGVHAGHVEGFNCQALEEASHAEGDSSVVDVGAFAGHAEGSSFCQGNRSHSEGDGTITHVAATASHAEGMDSETTGVASHAEGRVCFAVGDYSHAEGRNCIATGVTSHAQGNLSHALREGQFAHASGSFQGFAIDEGNAQTSVLVLRGETTGLAINETVVLGFGVNDPPTTLAIVLEDDKAYDFTITTTIGARQAGPVQVSRTIKTDINVRRVAGVAVIAATGAGDAYGDATTGTFVLTPTVAAGNLVLTFGSGAGPISKCFVAARVQFTEVRFQPT